MITRSNAKTLLFLGLLFFFSLVGQAYSQRGIGGGENSIVGTVFAPSNSPAMDIRVKLISSTSREQRTTTDRDGKFFFGELGDGNYTVIIDEEKEYESISQQVDINLQPLDRPRPFNVLFHLTPTKQAAGKPKPQIINAANAGVPKAALDLYEKALELSKAGDHTGAIEQLRAAIAAYPMFMMAFNELGVQYLTLNELAKADEALIAALKIKPGSYEPLINRGIAYVRLKRYTEAEAMLRSALQVKDQSAVGHYYLGRSLMAQKNFDDARKEFAAAIAIGGDETKEAHRLLVSIFLEKGENKLAAAELETYLKLNPGARDAEQLRETLKQINDAEGQPAVPQKP